MADQWLGVNSSNIDSFCGEESPLYTLARGIDAIAPWSHFEEHLPHWFILDLGQTYTIKKGRGQSSTSHDPADVDVYVSDDKENWGDPVKTGISTWGDAGGWHEEDLTVKDGRYIKVVINDTHGVNDSIAWGWIWEDPGILDFYGDVAAEPENPYPVSRLRKDVIHGYNCFLNAYVLAKLGGFDPLKLPDGTLF